jgi:hypothetical protein
MQSHSSLYRVRVELTEVHADKSRDTQSFTIATTEAEPAHVQLCRPLDVSKKEFRLKPVALIKDWEAKITPLEGDKVFLEMTLIDESGTSKNKSRELVITGRQLRVLREVKLGRKFNIPIEHSADRGIARRWMEVMVEKDPVGVVEAAILPQPVPVLPPPPMGIAVGKPFGVPFPVPAAPAPECLVAPSYPYVPAPCHDCGPVCVCPPMPGRMVMHAANPVPAPRCGGTVASEDNCAAMCLRALGLAGVPACGGATDSTTIRSVTENGQDRLEIRHGSGARLTCSSLSVAIPGHDALQLTPGHERVVIASKKFTATAESLAADRNDQLELTGRVELTCELTCLQQGKTAFSLVADKASVDLRDGRLNMEAIGINFK